MSVEDPLPIPDIVGSNPFFEIEQLLHREGETGRVECSFAAIQGYIRSHTGRQIPSRLAEPLAQMGRWQLIYPNTFEVSQILFIGRAPYPKGYIPIAEAEATIYLHRGVEEWLPARIEGYRHIESYPVGPYTSPWKMELASVYPDSNGDQRILGVYYRLHTEKGDFSMQEVRTSIRDDELLGREKESDTVWGPVLELQRKYYHRHPFYEYGWLGIVTPGMLRLTSGHRRLLVASPFHNLSETFDDMLPKKKNAKASRTRGIYGVVNQDEWEVGLNIEGTSTPWKLPVPGFLEKSALLSE